MNKTFLFKSKKATCFDKISYIYSHDHRVDFLLTIKISLGLENNLEIVQAEQTSCMQIICLTNFPKSLKIISI